MIATGATFPNGRVFERLLSVLPRITPYVLLAGIGVELALLTAFLPDTIDRFMHGPTSPTSTTCTSSHATATCPASTARSSCCCSIRSPGCRRWWRTACSSRSARACLAGDWPHRAAIRVVVGGARARGAGAVRAAAGALGASARSPDAADSAGSTGRADVPTAPASRERGDVCAAVAEAAVPDRAGRVPRRHAAVLARPRRSRSASARDGSRSASARRRPGRDLRAGRRATSTGGRTAPTTCFPSSSRG